MQIMYQFRCDIGFLDRHVVCTFDIVELAESQSHAIALKDRWIKFIDPLQSAVILSDDHDHIMHAGIVDDL